MVEIEETTKATKAALDRILKRVREIPSSSPSSDEFIKYTPCTSPFGAKQRMVRIVETALDPLEPPNKFKRKTIPCLSSSPPVPVIHSPPRGVTAKDENSWKIPPCVSKWKNPKGYTVPLHHRVGSSGSGSGPTTEDVGISVDFARLSEALYATEKKAREAVALRSKVKREMGVKLREEKERRLRDLADKARAEGVRLDRKRRKAEVMEGGTIGKRGKSVNDRDDRDVSEKVALGMANVGGKRDDDVKLYDQRLFNQEKGIGSGFDADDDQYNVYDKGLFAANSALDSIQYHPKKVVDIDSEIYGGRLPDEQVNADLFGLDQWFTQVRNKCEEQQDC